MTHTFVHGRAIAILTMSAFTSGCALLPPQSDLGAIPIPPECIEINSDYTTWHALEIASTALAGTGGLTTAFPEDGDTRVAIGAASLGVAIFGAVSAFVSSQKARLYAAAGCPSLP